MEPDEMFLDPTGSNFNESNLNQEAYYRQEHQRLLAEQQAGTINPNLIDEETGLLSTDSEGLNRYMRQKEEEQTQNTPNLLEAHERQQEEKQLWEAGAQKERILLTHILNQIK